MAYEPVRFALGANAGVVTPGHDGWMHWSLPQQPDVDVFVRVGSDPSGLVPTSIAVVATDTRTPVSGAMLRTIPMGRLTTALQHGRLAQLAIGALNSSRAPHLEPWSKKLAENLARIDELPVTEQRRASARLPMPPTRRKPLDWYWELLETHEQIALRSHRPAADLAEANDVSVEKIRQWSKQARRAVEESIAGRDVLRQDAERWHHEVDRRVYDLGMTWSGYCDRFDAPGSEDPVDAWDFAERDSFLRNQRQAGRRVAYALDAG